MKSKRQARTLTKNNLGPDADEFEELPSATSKAAAKAKMAIIPVRKPRTDDRNVPSPNAHPGRPSRPVVSMDNRNLTKAQRNKLAGWHENTRGKLLDAYFKGQAEVARKKFGHKAVLVASDMENLVVGIPTPSLAFEYMICQDVFPLGLVMHLNGEPGTCKSALLYEFFRWFGLAGGGANLMEVETKFSPELLDSICNYGAVPYILDRCNSVEDWQQRLLFWVTSWKTKLAGNKEEPGPGRTVPIVMGVDSIMGKASFETQEKVNETGFAGRNFPIEALSITTFMKTFPQMIDEWPFAVILNNHLKLRKDDDGREVRGTAGGRGVNFQESFELETSIAKRKITCADWDGVQVRIKCVKNSFGPTWRQIDTRMLWWDEVDPDHPDPDDPKHYRQRTVWDWDWATVKLLTTLQGKDAARVKEVFHITATKTSDVENAAWSKTLGMKEKDAVPWSVLGAMLRARTDVLDKIRVALSIKRRPLLAGDYLKQIESIRKQLP